MVEFGRHALEWLSANWPGVPYPFSKTTVVQGYADMEYPMMVNDNTTDDPTFSRFVVEHEIAHSWFPFYMGINESRYPFMDEGWATTLELLIGRADLGVDRADNAYKEFRINPYTYDPAQEEDLPIITPADAMKGVGYGNNAYGKASIGYLAMKDLLGDAQFKSACTPTWTGGTANTLSPGISSIPSMMSPVRTSTGSGTTGTLATATSISPSPVQTATRSPSPTSAASPCPSIWSSTTPTAPRRPATRHPPSGRTTPKTPS
ncbi:hypothetical protein ACQ86N_09975 [Puia sp. P3]|uniref:hypothetical protein n=1 Tax=Puia sp. P3 TaxID=3423952 RepID=UPI003D67A5D0